jgi:hypothetical protein
VAEQRERLEEALRGCAERGVPEGVDLWPSISGRVETRATGGARRAPRLARLVPNTRSGRAIALLAALLLSTGAYAAGGVLYATFRGELPGARGPMYGEQIDRTKAAGGARVTLGWAYADEKFVVVGFDVEDLAGERRVAGQPADLQSVLISEEPGYEERIEEEFPERVDLTDEGNTGFRMVGGQQQVSEGPENMMEGPNSNSAVFQAQGNLEPGDEHRFRLEVPLQEMAVAPPPGERWPDPEPVGEPFVFEFEVPVRPAPVVEVNERDTAGGITLTLERVSNSPGRPQGVFCFAPPDNEHDWFLRGEDLAFEGGPVAGRGHCLEMLLNVPLEGRSSVTVSEIEGIIPRCPSGNDEACAKRDRTIRGPWTFEFEVPAP